MRHTTVITSLIFVFLAIGCGKEPPPIEKKRIVDILMDVHIAEGLINSHHPVTMKDSLQKKYLAQVLDKWGISKEEFESALNHMHSDPDYMRAVYKSLQDQVNAYSKELGNEQSMEDEMKELM